MEYQKYCLITGASRGIGRDIAREFARNGHALILVARDTVALTVLRDELHGYTPDIKLFECDLGNLQACQNLIDQIKQQQLTVDVLINNAGIGLCDEFAAMSPATLLQMIHVNITALTLLTRQFLPDMLRRKQGYILNVASTAAFQPGPFMSVYYASKAYVLSFSEGLSEEVKQQGVVVSALCPGPTNTDFQTSAKTASTKLVNLLGYMPSSTVAASAYRGLLKGKRVIIPGILNKVLAVLAKITPNVINLKVLHYLQAKQRKRVNLS